MAKKPVPSPEVLRQLLRYEPETGKLFWRERGPEWFTDGFRTAQHNCKLWNVRYANKEAFSASSHGYRVGRILDQLMPAHRVVWAISKGEWPRHEIDHINGVKADNRLSNLRDVTTAENGRNKCLRSNNTSGHVGVSWSTAEQKWKVLCWKAGKPIPIGTFADLDEAVAARKEAEVMHGYHENHGRPKKVRK